MRYLIGVDDTDNLESRGTGHRVRQLANCLAQQELAQPLGITRHQLLVDPRIPYTSHNSSACLLVDANETRVNDLWEACRESDCCRKGFDTSLASTGARAGTAGCGRQDGFQGFVRGF